jgi:hypothetical protein
MKSPWKSVMAVRRLSVWELFKPSMDRTVLIEKVQTAEGAEEAA